MDLGDEMTDSINPQHRAKAGLIAEWAIENAQRRVMFDAGNNNYVPSQNDIDAVEQFLRIATAAERLSERRIALRGLSSIGSYALSESRSSANPSGT